MPTVFKLEGSGVTRRVPFPSRPTWHQLSAKIESLFNIPAQQLGCSYIDSDGDKVTLSTNEELVDYYQTMSGPNQAIKFAVHDLAALRHASAVAPINPNPFLTEPEFFDVGADWQRLPPPPNPFPPAPPSVGPHGFIESFASERTSTIKANEESEDDSDIVSVGYPDDTVIAQHLDKGKGRAMTEEDISSTKSVLGEYAPIKPPIHVMDMASTRSATATPSIISESAQSTVVPQHHEREEPALRLRSPSMSGSLHPGSTNGTAASIKPTESAAPTQNSTVEDPPLPELEPPIPATLSGDVAGLLSSLQRAFSIHPELAEGLRDIVNNATGGTYWANHRRNVHDAAEGIIRHAEAAGRVAEESGHLAEQLAEERLTQAMDSITQSLSSVFGTGTTRAPTTDEPMPMDDPISPAEGDPLNSQFPFNRRRGGTRRHGPHHRHSWFGWGPSAPRPFSSVGPAHPSVPPPAPPAFAPPPPVPPVFAPPPPVPPAFAPPPPPVPPAPFAHPPPPNHSPPFVTPYARPPTGPNVSFFGAPKHVSHAEQRERLKEAKRRYKEEKARYRQQVSELKESPLSNKPTPSVSTSNPNVIIASNPRGPFPGLQVVSVGNWSNARPSTQQRAQGSLPNRRHTSDTTTPNARASPGPSTLTSSQRITRRLADMGFNQHAYKELPEKIASHIGPNEAVSKTREDEIVTLVLDEMLVLSPRSHQASTVAFKQDKDMESVPGSWE